MADLINTSRELISKVSLDVSIGISGNYMVATIHRASNTDDLDQLNRILSGLRDLKKTVFLVAHPRLVAAARKHNLNLEEGMIKALQPLGYLQMLKLISDSTGVITDSGGLQKEAFLLGVPCITVRTETEWPETLEGGMNVLDPEAANLTSLVDRSIKTSASRPYGDGFAAKKIIEILKSVNIEERK